MVLFFGGFFCCTFQNFHKQPQSLPEREQKVDETDRILNASIRKKPNFKSEFAKKRGVYKNRMIDVPKKAKSTPAVVEIVHYYSRILSQMVSDIKMDWFEFDEGDPTTVMKFAHKMNSGRTGTFWAYFVELTRKSFPTSTTDIIYNPNTDGMRPPADAQERLKKAWTAVDFPAGIGIAATGMPPSTYPSVSDQAYPGFAAFCAFNSSQSLTDNFKGATSINLRKI